MEKEYLFEASCIAYQIFLQAGRGLDDGVIDIRRMMIEALPYAKAMDFYKVS